MAAKPSKPRAKKPAAPARPGRGWYTRAELAEIFDVSQQQLDDYRKLTRGAGEQAAGKALYLRARTLIDALVADRERKAKPPEIVADPLMAGAAAGDSASLERYRAARADLAEMERDRLRGSLVPRSELEPALAKTASVLRSAGDFLQRTFSPDAAEVLNRAVDEAAAAWAAMLTRDDAHQPDPGRPAEDGGPDPHPAAAVRA